jgi:hypothetical protein
MTSSINPNLINGLYPIAGQDNDSQGFRDNFTNIKNNFNIARTEVTDLQNKAILKSALTGGTLNNNMGGSILSNVALNTDSHTITDHGTFGDPAIMTTLDIDYYQSTVHLVQTAGAIEFEIINMPLGKWSSVKLLINVTDTDHYIRFSSTSNNNGWDRVEGIDVVGGQLIYFANTGTYLFEISSQDGGQSKSINDVFRGRSFTDFDFTVNGALTATGDTTVEGTISTAAGKINTGYFFANVVAGQNLFANVDYNRFICNASPSPLSTLSNLFITLPSDPSDGQEITITSLVPITSCFVSNMTPGVQSVYWLANTWASSGNVSATLIYNEPVKRWMKV